MASTPGFGPGREGSSPSPGISRRLPHRVPHGVRRSIDSTPRCAKAWPAPGRRCARSASSRSCIGCIAILLPELFALGAAIFIGIVLVIVSAFLAAAAFAAHGVGSFLARLAWALLTFVVGLWLILEPHNGTLTLTLVLGIYFLLMGLTRITVAFLGRGQPNAGWSASAASAA